MLIRWVVLMAWLLSSVTVEAGTLKGVVLANQIGGTPVGKVPISAPGANPTETDSTGSFTLRFPNAQPGDVVQLVVSQPAYVVVNYIQLRPILPKNPESEVLIVLLCKEEHREEWTRQFYRLKAGRGGTGVQVASERTGGPKPEDDRGDGKAPRGTGPGESGGRESGG